MILLSQYSIFSSTMTTLILSVIFLFLSHQSGRLYMRQWGFCWLLYSLMFFLDFANLQTDAQLSFYLPLRQGLSVVGSYLFLLGTHHFFQVRPPKVLLLTTVLSALLACSYDVLAVLYNSTIILNVIYCSGLLLYAGCMFMAYSWTQNLPEKIIASFLIILWAMFINHLGFALDFANIALFAYFIGIFTVNLLILCLIIIDFKKIRFLDVRQAARYRLLVENSSDSMFLYNYKTRSFEYVSPLIDTLIGVSAQQLYAMPERFFDYIETIKKNRSILTLFSRPARVPAKGILCRMKDGQIIKWVEIHCMPIVDSMGNATAVEGILRDITERKQMEEQLYQAEQEKKALLENISHEIRTPVTLIQGYAESLLNNIVPDDSRATYLRMISAKATMLTNLLEDLIQVSHFSSQSLEYSFYEFNSREFFSDCMDQSQFQIQQTGHVFRKQFSIKRQVTIIIDPYRINQVISNLINNAVRHTPYGEMISVFCYQRPYENTQNLSADEEQPLPDDENTIPNGEIIFTVSDFGDGIPELDLPHIFERKFRGTNKIDAGAGKNAGLGLYISMQIITQHSGRMWARNNTAGGAEISFAIPYYE